MRATGSRDVDPYEVDERWAPEMVAWFDRHRRRWAAREIRLDDFCERWIERDGKAVPLWYPEPLGLKVMVDKAVYYRRVGYWPSEPACRAHASLAHVKYFSGGARAGKSLWGAMEVAPILLTPGTRGWILGPEYTNTIKEFEYLRDSTVGRPDVKAVIEASGARVSRCVSRADQGSMEIRISWPDAPDSWARCKSAKTLPALLSEELDWVLVCEAALIRGEVWENKIRMRLVDRNGVALFPSSPAGTGWTKELYDRGLEGLPGHFAISADTRTNPKQDLESVRFWSEQMSHVDFEEQVRGRPTPRHGLVYPGFDMDVHVRSWLPEWPQPGGDGPPNKRSWKRVRGCDFGFQDPHVTLWIAFDEDRRAYVYREFYRRHTLVDDVAEHIARVEGREYYRDDRGRIRVSHVAGGKDPVTGATITDWDAQMRAELSARGIRCRRARKDVLAGIATVASHLKTQRDGRPRLYVHPSCRNLIREFRDYQWARDGGDRPEDGNDHALDALRYALHTLRGGGRKPFIGRIGGS